MKELRAKNFYYYSNIATIGGIETFFYQLAKKYKDKDLVLVYKSGDPKQLERISKYIECVKYDKNTIYICEKAFFNYKIETIDSFKAKEYIVIIHGDYKSLIENNGVSRDILPLHPKITKYYAVSQHAAKTFTEITGKECSVCYNPIELDYFNKTLKLISATRLTHEKGKDRMIQLIKILEDNNIPYQWTIFTNDRFHIKNKNIIYKAPTLDILKYIAEADYLVQLSDNEGYCYSIVEALCLGVPVICTPCPVFKEIGLIDKKNCFMCDYDMKNVPIQEIYQTKLDFTYTPKKDTWNDLLAPGESQFQKKKKTRVRVKATELYKQKHILDVELNKIPAPQEEWETSLYRYEYLSNLGYVTLVTKI